MRCGTLITNVGVLESAARDELTWNAWEVSILSHMQAKASSAQQALAQDRFYTWEVCRDQGSTGAWEKEASADGGWTHLFANRC
jgi:hypothetical protein